MRIELIIWALVIVFYTVIGAIYWLVGGDPAGASLLLMATVPRRARRRVDLGLARATTRHPRPQDRVDADAGDETGIVGVFPTASLRPLALGVGHHGRRPRRRARVVDADRRRRRSSPPRSPCSPGTPTGDCSPTPASTTSADRRASAAGVASPSTGWLAAAAAPVGVPAGGAGSAGSARRGRVAAVHGGPRRADVRRAHGAAPRRDHRRRAAARAGPPGAHAAAGRVVADDRAPAGRVGARWHRVAPLLGPGLFVVVLFVTHLTPIYDDALGEPLAARGRARRLPAVRRARCGRPCSASGASGAAARVGAVFGVIAGERVARRRPAGGDRAADADVRRPARRRRAPSTTSARPPRSCGSRGCSRRCRCSSPPCGGGHRPSSGSPSAPRRCRDRRWSLISQAGRTVSGLIEIARRRPRLPRCHDVRGRAGRVDEAVDELVEVGCVVEVRRRGGGRGRRGSAPPGGRRG